MKMESHEVREEDVTATMVTCPSENPLISWLHWGGWAGLHLTILPFIQGCMFSLGFYLVKAKLVPWLFGSARR